MDSPETRVHTSLQVSWSLLSLPPEILHIVLKNLVVSERQIKFYHVKKPHDSLVRNHLCLSDYRHVADNFLWLCLVSKEMHAQTKKIFFEENTVGLELYSPEPETKHICSPGSKRSCPDESELILRNTMGFLLKNLGARKVEKLRRLDISITFPNFALCVHDNKNESVEIMKEIIKRATTLEQSKNLLHLTLRFKDTKGRRIGGVCDDDPSPGRREDGMRESDGPNGSEKEYRYSRSVTLREMALYPFHRLRGIGKAMVLGDVSDEWAVKLETCIQSKRSDPPHVLEKP
ncbi:hypothetical protein B0J14DRAFT_340611 [Halenospora varia]|nr:hypothetical protein B0J14DRAFT_340611 [Halenospora varia]